MGSPPRVRGKLIAAFNLSGSPRITPACAGKTYIAAGTDVRAEDHPRVCGENSINWTCQSAARGSPPRVRGKLIHDKNIQIFARIPPACAGKTIYHGLFMCLCQDHPRVCGENSNFLFIEINNSGSPPRVRGKPRIKHWERPYIGITPACAGKTYCPQKFRQNMWDHPRVCGENSPFENVLNF